MRKGIIVALAGIVLVLAVLFALRSTTGVEIRLDGSVISDTYEETMEYRQGLTYDVLEEQLLSRVQFIEDGTDITAEVRVRGSQEGLVSLGTHELEFVRSDDSVLLHLRVVITDTTPPTLQGTASYTAGTGTSFKAENLDLQVLRGERLVIAGPNGAGKSTLLQVLDGKRRPSGGMVRLGAGAKPGIFEQQQLRRGGTVISTIWDAWPRFTELEVRSHLARFGFRGEDVFKPCPALSGGELARLRFAELVLERPNLMFLDEPTNHLDIYTRESLTEALAAYEGTLVMVTHDRYLMNTLGCPILYLEDGKATVYPSYDALMNRGNAAAAPVQEKPKDSKPAYGKEQRRRRAELRTRIRQLETQIEELGADIVGYENAINDPEVLQDYQKLQQTCDDLEDAKFRQQELFDEWENLMEEQEALEAEES